MKRTYPKRDATNWVEEVLEEWSSEVKSRPTMDVTVTPGGRFPENMYEGGPSNGGETARGIATRQSGPPEVVMLGYRVKGLVGRAARANWVMLQMGGQSPQAFWAIRAEYGLVDSVDPEADEGTKGRLLGAYIDGRAWAAGTYKDRLRFGKQLFAMGFVCAPVEKPFQRG